MRRLHPSRTVALLGGAALAAALILPNAAAAAAGAGVRPDSTAGVRLDSTAGVAATVALSETAEGSTLNRCSLQVSDTAKAATSPSGYALDTGTFAGDPAGVSPASATPVHKSYSSNLRTLWDSAPTDSDPYFGNVPTALAVDAGTAAAPTSTIVASWTHNPDVGNATVQTYTSTSPDNGATWPTPVVSTGDDPVMFTQLRDGRVLGVSFKGGGDGAAGVNLGGSITGSTGAPSTAVRITVHAADLFTGGTAAALRSWMRVAGRPLQINDGSVLLPIYGDDATDPTGKHGVAALLRATPPAGNAAWTFTPVRANLSLPPSSTNHPVVWGQDQQALMFSEVGLLQRTDGSLIAVLRQLPAGANPGLVSTLLWSSSTNGGLTWSALSDMTGSLSGWNGNGSPQPGGGTRLVGISPQLTLLPSGIIALSSGKPDNWIAYSTTGNASGWSGRYTYRNCPTTAVIPSQAYWGGGSQGYPSQDPEQWRYGSSANTALVSAGGHDVFQYGDNCHAFYWGCVRTYLDGTALPGQSPYTIDLTSRIWQRQVSIVGPNTGKLDLAGMLKSGQATASGTFTWTSSEHPRSGVTGAVDGSTGYWSSAVSSGQDGVLTLDLGKSYTLNRVGLSLRRQLPESATVTTSADGTTWSTLTTRTNVTSYALGYTDVTPTAARYVRVTVPQTSSCDAGLAASCAFLNELELYSTVDGFENDPWGNLPRGATTAVPAQQTWVTADTTGGSHYALRLSDNSDSQPAQIGFDTTAATAHTLTFRVKPESWASGTAGGFLFNLRSGTTAAYQLAVFKDGTLHWYNGSAYSGNLATGSVPLGSWSTITLVYSQSGGTTVRVNNGAAVTIGTAASVTSVNGYTFSSSGTSPIGDHVLIDDVQFS